MALPFYTAWKTVSSTPSEYWKDSFQALVDSEFENSPTVKTVLHNGTSVVVRVVGKFSREALTRNNDDYQKIIFQDYDYAVSVGDLFVFDSLSWLCTDIGSTAVTKSCTVQICNNTLSFYSTTDSTLYSIPCIITNKITLNDSENNYLSTVDNQIYMMCSSSTTTKQIKPDDIFKLGTYNYQVTTVFDDVTIPGILIFKMKYSEVEATTHVFAVEILNGSTIDLQESTTLQLNVNVYDSGVLVSPTPPLTFTSSDTTICTVGSSTGLVTALEVIDDCVISVSANGVSDSIVVNVIEVEQHNYTAEISGSTSIVKAKTSTYTCVFKDNGVAITDTSVFYLTADDGVSTTTLATITSQDGTANTCVVTAGSTLGYVKLWVKNDDETIVSSSFRIQIKSLF